MLIFSPQQTNRVFAELLKQALFNHSSRRCSIRQLLLAHKFRYAFLKRRIRRGDTQKGIKVIRLLDPVFEIVGDLTAN